MKGGVRRLSTGVLESRPTEVEPTSTAIVRAREQAGIQQ